MKTVRFLDKTVDLLAKAALLCGGILLLVMAFNVTYGVVTRYVFHNPSVVAIELTKILMIPALVVAVSYVQRNDRHLRVDFLASRFPQKVQTVLFEILVPIAALFVTYAMVWKGYDAAAYSYTINETGYSAWREVLWPVKATIPIGYGLLFLVLFAQLCRGVAMLFVRQNEGPESPKDPEGPESPGPMTMSGRV